MTPSSFLPLFFSSRASNSLKSRLASANFFFRPFIFSFSSAKVSFVLATSSTGAVSASTVGSTFFFSPRSSAISSRKAARLASASSVRAFTYSFCSSPSYAFLASRLSLSSFLVIALCSSRISARRSFTAAFSISGSSLFSSCSTRALTSSRALAKRSSSLLYCCSSLSMRASLSSADIFFDLLASRICFSRLRSLPVRTELNSLLYTRCAAESPVRPIAPSSLERSVS